MNVQLERNIVVKNMRPIQDWIAFIRTIFSKEKIKGNVGKIIVLVLSAVIPFLLCFLFMKIWSNLTLHRNELNLIKQEVFDP